ncbi:MULTISPECIES: WhiB family transcriptional regulator [unclassified Microbacterium]|uniref:WhiB family transcriptional regulator n=1 Tax=unclassified Microbacterium TaxID=2609290 RepID=UPI000DE2D6A6|nr:hypothetical protein DSP71_18750 [Microbacterium sp. H6]
MSAAAAWAELSRALLVLAPACDGDDRFISDGRSSATSTELASICADCPVLTVCRSYASEARPHTMAGFWGGRWRGKPLQHEAVKT